MVQRLKPEVRERILDAATQVLMERGFHGATVARIAAVAELSAGNIYRYFQNKEALYDAVIDDGFVDTFEELLRSRVGALAALGSLVEPDLEARERQARLLDFLVEHRSRVVILLDRSEGTRHADFAGRFVALMADLAHDDLQSRSPVAPHVRPLLTSLFDGTRRTLVAILEQHAAPDPIRQAFATFWSFQLAGLDGLRNHCSSAAGGPPERGE